VGAAPQQQRDANADAQHGDPHPPRVGIKLPWPRGGGCSRAATRWSTPHLRITRLAACVSPTTRIYVAVTVGELFNCKGWCNHTEIVFFGLKELTASASVRAT
jgi:hypothetical protein